MKQCKNTVQTVQNTVNTSTHITKTLTHTHTHPHVTKQVKTTTVQDNNYSTRFTSVNIGTSTCDSDRWLLSLLLSCVGISAFSSVLRR